MVRSWWGVQRGHSWGSSGVTRSSLLLRVSPNRVHSQNTFTRWCNEHLKGLNRRIADLQRDLSDGLKLIGLLEVLSLLLCVLLVWWLLFGSHPASCRVLEPLCSPEPGQGSLPAEPFLYFLILSVRVCLSE
uniref:Calponin-homology (CH) domain-containing protein n=1 Tax=Xiphophorus couchianus TaxID=32473 RepID=A0A3B5LUJ1_9TELE